MIEQHLLLEAAMQILRLTYLYTFIGDLDDAVLSVCFSQMHSILATTYK